MVGIELQFEAEVQPKINHIGLEYLSARCVFPLILFERELLSNLWQPMEPSPSLWPTLSEYSRISEEYQ